MGFCLYVILYFELVLYSGKILVLDISSIFIGKSNLILISLRNCYCVKLAMLSVMSIPLYKDVMCIGKGTQVQAYRPFENVQPQSSVNPGYCMMDRESIAQLMRPFFLENIKQEVENIVADHSKGTPTRTQSTSKCPLKIVTVAVVELDFYNLKMPP